MPRVCVLIVEDEANIRSGLRDLLATEGYEVLEAKAGEQALDLLHRVEIDVAIVDIRLNGISGVEVLEAFRKDQPHTAVILLTGHGTMASAMAAVRAGAFDYLLKPARPQILREVVRRAAEAAVQQQEEARLVASLRAGLERLDRIPGGKNSSPPRSTGSITVGQLQIDTRSHEVRLGDRLVPLSPTEYKLLVALALELGAVVENDRLVRESLDYRVTMDEASDLVKRHIYSLRRKIERNPSAPRYLLNVRGIGYRLVSPGEAGAAQDPRVEQL